jgi:hypothetical protein
MEGNKPEVVRIKELNPHENTRFEERLRNLHSRHDIGIVPKLLDVSLLRRS